MGDVGVGVGVGRVGVGGVLVGVLVGVGNSKPAGVEDVAMTQEELLAVLSDVLELGESVPLVLVPLLHAIQAEGWGLGKVSVSVSGSWWGTRSNLGSGSGRIGAPGLHVLQESWSESGPHYQFRLVSESKTRI